MKSVTCAALAGAVLLSGCSTLGMPYVSDRPDCGDIVDARERLDCYDRADRAEDEWREEKRREAEAREKTETDKD